MRNTPYALRTYLQTYDNTVSKYVPLDLFPDQVSLIVDYDKYNENVALKYRQAGVSTVTAAWASKKISFAQKNKPEKVFTSMERNEVLKADDAFCPLAAFLRAMLPNKILYFDLSILLYYANKKTRQNIIKRL